MLRTCNNLSLMLSDVIIGSLKGGWKGEGSLRLIPAQPLLDFLIQQPCQNILHSKQKFQMIQWKLTQLRSGILHQQRSREGDRNTSAYIVGNPIILSPTAQRGLRHPEHNPPIRLIVVRHLLRLLPLNPHTRETPRPTSSRESEVGPPSNSHHTVNDY